MKDDTKAKGGFL